MTIAENCAESATIAKPHTIVMATTASSGASIIQPTSSEHVPLRAIDQIVMDIQVGVGRYDLMEQTS